MILPTADQWSTSRLFVAATAGGLFYSVVLTIYRLYFSKYARYPGPKLAAISKAYMIWYDLISGSGQYMYRIKKLHEQYDSPIIRIAPNELHVMDPDFYDVLFASAPARRDKPPTVSHAFSNIDSTFGTILHDQHRVRRNALNPFFSTTSLRKLEPVVLEKISRLVAVFRKYQNTGEPMSLRPAFGALTSDVITEYCFGLDENYIEAPGFNSLVLEATDALLNATHVTVHAQWLPKLLNMLPDMVIETLLGEGAVSLNVLKRHCTKKIKDTIATRGEFINVKHRTIFQEVLENTSLPEEDKSVDRLWQEVQALVGAGTVTTTTAISKALVFLLLDEKRLISLLEELEYAMPDINKPLSATDLERLPYLSGVVQETLRLDSGVSYRLTRSAPTETLQVGDWTIPPDTALCMHYPFIHFSPELYPEPMSFIPERWLPFPAPETPYNLPSLPNGICRGNAKYPMPFSKGTRNCIGWPLANMEMYLTIAIVCRTFLKLERDEEGKVVGVSGMKLFETDRRDTDMASDNGFPLPQKGRGNMRVLFE